MLIDWFTVVAQALNFIVLVWLLKRFLYKPIRDAIDAREQRIAKELADAAAKEAEAQREREEYRQKNETLDRQRVDLLAQATNDAKVERHRLLDLARKEAEALSAKRQETLRNDARALNQAITRRTQQEVFAIARKALADLAGAQLEQRMCETFIRHVRDLRGEVKAILVNALGASKQPAIVRTTFDLSSAQQAAIQAAINESFSIDLALRFATTPDLVSGIELLADGHKLSWSIGEYLASMEHGVGELLRAQDAEHPKGAIDSKTS